MNKKIRFAQILSAMLLLGLCSCDTPGTSVAESNSGSVALAPRFTSNGTTPKATRLECKLTESGKASQVINVAHASGTPLTLGNITSGADFSLTVLGYDSASGQRIARFWGSASGKAGSEAQQIVAITLASVPTAPVVTPSSPKAGATLALSSGMHYTTDSTDPRTSETAQTANGPIIIENAGTVKAVAMVPSDPTTGAPTLWSDVSIWTFTASQTLLNVGGLSSPAPSFIGFETNPAQAYTGNQSKTSYDSIDLIVTTNADGTGSVFESTAQAYANHDLTASYWTRATLIAAVPTAPASIEAAKTVTLTTQSAPIADGGVYVVKTVDNVYAILTVSKVSGIGDAVTLTVNVVK